VIPRGITGYHVVSRDTTWYHALLVSDWRRSLVADWLRGANPACRWLA